MGGESVVAPFPFPPWHLWGSAGQLTVASGAVGPGREVVATQQLLRVSYRRPDSWRFLFFGRITGGVTAAAVTTSVHALFDVTLGVGRAALITQKPISGGPANLNAFCQMRWELPVGVVPGENNYNIKYATSVPGPPLDDTVQTTETIEVVVAQDIQCLARLVMTAGDPAVRISAELGAFFAPNVHTRPDWYAERNQFRGAEVGGT